MVEAPMEKPSPRTRGGSLPISWTCPVFSWRIQAMQGEQAQDRPKELVTDDEMPRPRIVHAFSAGGVVFRVTEVASPPSQAPCPTTDNTSAAARLSWQGVEVALVGFLRDDTWTLPKAPPRAAKPWRRRRCARFGRKRAYRRVSWRIWAASSIVLRAEVCVSIKRCATF